MIDLHGRFPGPDTVTVREKIALFRIFIQQLTVEIIDHKDEIEDCKERIIEAESRIMELESLSGGGERE